MLVIARPDHCDRLAQHGRRDGGHSSNGQLTLKKYGAYLLPKLQFPRLAAISGRQLYSSRAPLPSSRRSKPGRESRE